MGNIPLDLFATFLVFVESNSVMSAARKLHLSQPAVSAQLKKLESSLPYPLFSHEGRRKVLSPYGRALYAELKDRINEIRQCVNRVNLHFSSPDRLHLRIGGPKGILNRLAPKLHFSGTLELMEMTCDEATEKLLAHSLDFAISYQRPLVSNIIARKLSSCPMHLIVHRQLIGDEPLTLEKIQSPDFLTQVPCIAFDRHTPYLKEWATHCGIAVPALRVSRICGDWAVIATLVEAKFGFSIVPTSIAVSNPDVLSSVIPGEVLPEIALHLLYHSDLKGFPVIRDLLNLQGAW